MSAQEPPAAEGSSRAVADAPAETAPSPPNGTHAGRAVGWIEGLKSTPWYKLLVFAWILGSPVYTFVETRYCVPRRMEAQEREVAIREGRHYPPMVKVWIASNGLNDACAVRNVDGRPIRDVRVTRGMFPIDLSEPCAKNPSFGEMGWTHVETLEPHSTVAEAVEPGGEPLARVALPLLSAGCAPTHDCLVLIECRAHYRRAADLRQYSSSAWGVLDSKPSPSSETNQPMIEPAYALVQGTPDGALADWKDERHRRAFACVRDLLARRTRDQNSASEG